MLLPKSNILTNIAAITPWPPFSRASWLVVLHKYQIDIGEITKNW
jgi:hypothetical protein